MSFKTTESRPLLLLVPHYIGSFRYFEKIAPVLREKYDIKILILFDKAEFYEELISYAKNKGFDYIAMKPPRHKTGAFFFDFGLGLVQAKREVKRILKTEGIRKIVCVNDNSIHLRYLFAEAQKMNIDTLTIQWALTYPGQRTRPKKKTTRMRRIMYRLGKPVVIYAKHALTSLVLGSKFNREKGPIGAGASERLGVINVQAQEYFIREGIPREKITVVGNPDFPLAEDTKKILDTEERPRAATARALGVDLSKRQIVIFSSPFNSKDVSMLSDREQYQYMERIVKTIRMYCGKDAYQILFKIHPSESLDLYWGLESYGVTLFGKDTDNFNLIYFADLYIAHGSTTNFIPIIMKKQAIFINLFKLVSVEGSREFFGIKKLVHEWDEMDKAIREYSNEALPLQYENKPEIFTSNSMQKIVQWIDADS